jgi:hypothetical protein
VFYNNNSVAERPQMIEGLDEAVDVAWMEPYRGFVQTIKNSG